MAFDIEGARQSGYSDDEILQYLSEQRGFDLSGAREYYDDTEILAHLSGFPSPAAPVEEPDTTFFGQVGETLKAVPRGFANSFLSAGEGVAELADAATNALGFEDAIDSGDQNALVAASREGRRLVQEYLGADEAYRDEWLTKFGEGVGSFASFFTPAVAAKALGLAGKAATATQRGLAGTLAGGAGAGEQAQRIQAARDAGIEVTQEQEDKAIFSGGIVGLSEIASVERLLKRIPKDADEFFRQGLVDRLKSALVSGGIEGGQEVLAAVFQDAIERGFYNENLPQNESLWDDFTVGGAIGSLADLALNSAAGRIRTQTTQAQREYEQKLRDDQNEAIAQQEAAVSRAQAQDAAERLPPGASQMLADQEQQQREQDAEIDPSQIAPPSPRQVTPRITTPGRYVTVRIPEVDPETGDRTFKSFQAEQRTRVSNNRIINFVEEPQPDGTFKEVILSVSYVPEGFDIDPATGQQVPKQRVTEAARNVEVIEGVEAPETIQRTRRKNPMQQYARHVARVLGPRFPVGTKFEVKQNDEGGFGELVNGVPKFAVVDSRGRQYGVSLDSLEDAAVFAGSLNEEMINSEVMNGIDQILDTAPQTYTPEQASALRLYGFRALHPDQNTYTSAAIDLAAGTTQADGFDQLQKASVLLQQGAKPSQLTASQRINAKRLERGLPEVDTFTVEEARSVLGENFGNLADPSITGEVDTETYSPSRNEAGEFIVVSTAGEVLDGRPPTLRERDQAVKARRRPPKKIRFANKAEAQAYATRLNENRGINQINFFPEGSINSLKRLLRAKNIDNTLNDPEFKQLAELLAGVKIGNRRVADLRPGEIKVLYQKLRSLPRFSAPTKLPSFKLKSYTRNQFQIANKLIQSGVVDPEAIGRSVGIDTATPEGQRKVNDLLGDLRSQGAMEQAQEVEQVAEEGPILALPGPPERITALRESLQKSMDTVGLKDVALHLDHALQNVVRNADGELVFGVRARRPDDPETARDFGSEGRFVRADVDERVGGFYTGALNRIALAVDRAPANATREQQEEFLLGILGHEQLHAMRNLDLFTQREWSILTKLAQTKKNKDGETYLERAKKDYAGTGEVIQIEEAIAELTRDARKNRSLVAGKPRKVMERITDFMIRLKNFVNGAGFQSFEDVINRIESGEIGGRERGQIRTLYRTELETGRPTLRVGPQVAVRGDTAPPPPRGTARVEDFPEELLDEREARTKAGKPDTSVRPEVAAAYEKFVKGQITRKQYDAVVLGTISPYAEIPEPATYEEMYNALDSKKKPNINVPIKDGAPVGLRLDIPAYKDHGVWVPTIHFKGPKGESAATSHRATALIQNADFSRASQKTSENIMEGSVPGTPGYEKRQEIAQRIIGPIEEIRQSDMTDEQKRKAIDKLKSPLAKYNKTSYAQILGNFVNRSDAENAALAEEALNDPAWTQVGFDPRRHSYFYDRATGEPVTAAEEVVQVGPLVLAKNATKNVLPSGEVFETRYALLPMEGEARRLGITSEGLMPTAEEIQQMRDGTYRPQQKRNLIEAARYLHQRWMDATGRTDPFEYNDETLSLLADAMAEESIAALENDANAIGWYDSKIKAAKAVMRLVDPRITENPDSEAAFDFVLAVSSNGQAVADNFKYAAQLFEFYKKNGRLPSNKKEFSQGGERNEAMLEAFNFFNAYNESGAATPLREFLDQDFTVKELKAFAKDFNERVGFAAIKIPSAEGVNVAVKGSYVLGPKIGQGFYQNIRGNYDPLTMDIWWMRMWNRMVGRPFKAPQDLATGREELRKLLSRAGGLPRKLIGEVAEGQDQPLDTILQDDDLTDQFIQDLESRYQKYYKDYKKRYKRNHVKPEIFKKTGTHVKNMDDQLQATPKNATEREFMRRVVNEAKRRLTRRNINITTADLQALLWYPEKQLYRSLGVAPGRGSDNDYLDAAIMLAEEKGVSRGKIEKALRDADRGGAVDGEPSAARQDGPVRRDAQRVGRAEEIREARLPQEEGLAELRYREPARVERTVEENEEAAVQRGDGFPRYSYRAEPDAQYVAQNPEDAAIVSNQLLDRYARSNTPELSQEEQDVIGRNVAPAPEGVTPGQTYMDVTGESKISYMLTKLKQQAINRFARLEKLNQDPRLKNHLAETSSISAALLADRAKGILAAALKYGPPTYSNGVTKAETFVHNGKEYRGLIDVMAPLYANQYGQSLEEIAQAYAIARRAERLKARGIKAPTQAGDLQKIQQVVNRYVNEETGRPIVEEWFDAWQAYNAKTVEFLKNTGMLDEQTADVWANASDYIPFYRQAEGEELGGVPGVFSGLTSASEFDRIKGSERAVNVPLLEAITRNLSVAIEMGMKNVAQQRIVRDMITLGMARQIPMSQPSGNYMTVTLKVKGKKRKFIIDDPLIYESMQPLADGEMTQLLNRFLGAPSRLLRETVTRDPGFMTATMLRDTLSAWVTSGSSFVPVIDTVRGLSDGMETLEKYGVVGGYDFSNDPNDVVNFFNKQAARRGYKLAGQAEDSIVFKPFIKLWDALGEATTRADAATRKAVYDDVLARTGSEQEAAFQALESMNFGRRGSSALARVLTTAIPFLNARFQGIDVLWRSFTGQYSANKELNRRQKTQSFIVRGTLLTALSSIYYMLVSDDEEYRNQNDEVRDNNFIIPTGTGVPVKIPIPFEVGILFKTIPERVLDASVGDTSSREMRESIQRAVISTFEINPLGIQAIAPIVEASMNHNFYTGRQIVPYYMTQSAYDELQSRSSSSQIAQFIGNEMAISPLKVDHIMYGYMGTLGSYVLDAVDMILRSPALTGEKEAVLPARRVYEYPVMKRFFGSEYASGAKEDFYQLNREVTRLVGSLNDLKKKGDAERYEAYLQSRGHLLGLRDSTNYIANELSKLRQQRTMIERSDMTAEQKRDMVDQIEEATAALLGPVPELKRYARLPAFEGRFAERLTGQ